MPRPPKPLNPQESWSAIFGATVRRLRLELNDPPLTQGEFGRLLGYSGAMISAIELGELAPSDQFLEQCEKELPAAQVLLAPLFVKARDEAAARRSGGQGGKRLFAPLEIATPTELTDPEALQALADGAAEAKALAHLAELSDTGSGTIDTIERRVDRYCRAYPDTSPTVLEPRVRGLLGDILSLLESRLTLAQRRRLMVAGGWLTALQSCLRFDVNDVAGAYSIRDLVFQLGQEADHQEIAAWSFELLAWFALVGCRYDELIEYAEAGIRLAPTSSAGVQLSVQEAKAWSRMGRQDEATGALERAQKILSSRPTPGHPEHHFVFDDTKLSFYAATCFAWLGEPDRGTEYANDVVEQCLAIPGRVRWPIRLAETRVDLGLIALQRREVPDACHFGTLALESQRRSGSTLGRVAELHNALVVAHPNLAEVRSFHDRYLTEDRQLREGGLA